MAVQMVAGRSLRIAYTSRSGLVLSARQQLQLRQHYISAGQPWRLHLQTLRPNIRYTIKNRGGPNIAAAMASTVTNKYDPPTGFLDGPAPNISKTVIDFKKEGIPEYENCWAVVLDGVLSEDECKQLVTAAEARTNGEWERAMVNIGGGRQAMYEDTRKCGRIIWDDREVVAKIWARVEAAVPDIHRLENWPGVTGIGPVRRKEVWKMSRLNERMRFLKYVGGEYFKAHTDGTYETEDKTERSYFTLHLYLNDAEGQLEGGATTFHSWFNGETKLNVNPKSGRILLFQHRDLLHSGEDVHSGIKYTMRTDLMYACEKRE